MSSGVPIDKAQAVHAGGESALWKWISWNYFFCNRAARVSKRFSSHLPESCKISLPR
jgi:hypothetical protein